MERITVEEAKDLIPLKENCQIKFRCTAYYANSW